MFAFWKWIRRKPAPPDQGWPGPVVVGTAARTFEPRAVVTGERSHQLFVPDSVVDGWSTPHFGVRAASVRGDGHRFKGAPRQDSFIVTQHAGRKAIVIAVADGVSSAPLAHDGAAAVCRYATAAMLEALTEGGRPDLCGVVDGSAAALVELARRAGERAETRAAAALFATTLTIAVVLPTRNGARVLAASVGDSAIWRLRPDGLTRLAGGKVPDHADAVFSPAVGALPYLPQEIDTVECDLAPGDAVLVISDGIGDALGDGSGAVGELLKGQLRRPPAPLQVARIVDFSRASFADDRTLVGAWLLPLHAPDGPDA
jgi:serine/threonine protein phosphatase PrpC